MNSNLLPQERSNSLAETCASWKRRARHRECASQTADICNWLTLRFSVYMSRSNTRAPYEIVFLGMDFPVPCYCPKAFGIARKGMLGSGRLETQSESGPCRTGNLSLDLAASKSDFAGRRFGKASASRSTAGSGPGRIQRVDDRPCRVAIHVELQSKVGKKALWRMSHFSVKHLQ